MGNSQVPGGNKNSNLSTHNYDNTTVVGRFTNI